MGILLQGNEALSQQRATREDEKPIDDDIPVLYITPANPRMTMTQKPTSKLPEYTKYTL